MEYIISAFSSIKQNKGRTLLTMLGIIIGIASVITILSIGNGMKAFVNTSLDDMSSGGVTINIDQKKIDRYLTIEDLNTIKEAVPEILGVTMNLSSGATINVKGNDCYVGLNGGTADIYNEVTSGFYAGRFFREDDVEMGSAVCVIAQRDALLIFGTYDVLDKEFTVEAGAKSIDLKIIGITSSTDDELQSAYEAIKRGEQSYYYYSLYVPYTVLSNSLGLNSDKLDGFKFYTTPGMADETALKAKSVTENILDLRGENAVKIQSFASMASTYNRILNVVTMVVALIAAISLIVGGIGVMNIMTVTVTERTREIGIRKSLGARTQYILLQFLTESAVITLIGGFIGFVGGVAFTAIVRNFMSFPPVINASDVILVVLISIGDGLFFGIYPARRAAALNPIDALRQE
ncbi:ABC transporter permease [Butyrivibrio sp. MB2005]|uniref:ABC transporter permease n=1 Tax=Butyrivibrio sp. MB2005 TaxID=1280678 RepID=UPI00047B3247|nr:ABC transporter permease [Butyrivibrio sp. MB2005]